MRKHDEDAVRQALNRRLAALEASPALSASIRQRIAQEEESNMKKRKMPVALILAVVLMLISVSAVAAGTAFSKKTDAGLLADQALEKAYGVTPTMQSSYFGKTITEGQDGITVTYWGIEDLRWVLGEYTVTIRDGKATVAWSHDGESTEGGFDAEAWGLEQLKAMVAWSEAHHNLGDFYGKAKEIAARHNAGVQPVYPSEEEVAALRAGYMAESEQAQAAAKLQAQEMIALARQALVAAYGLTDAQMSLMECPQDIYEPWEYYSLRDGKPVYSVWFYLTQCPGANDETFSEFTEGDGIYVVEVNTETGVIEHMIYDSTLGGNG